MDEFPWDLNEDEEDRFGALPKPVRLRLVGQWVDRAIRIHMAQAFIHVGEEESASTLRDLPCADEQEGLSWCSTVMRAHLCCLLQESQLHEVAVFLREEADLLDQDNTDEIADHIFKAADKVHSLITHMGSGAVPLLLSGTHAVLKAVGHAVEGQFEEAAQSIEDAARTSPQLQHLLRMSGREDLPDPNGILCECIDAGTEGAIEEGCQQRAEVKALLGNMDDKKHVG